MKTGDILLFRGKGFISRVICFFSGSYSHVGMVLNSADFPEKFRSTFNLRDKEFYIFESTSISTVRDVYGRFVSGVQISLLHSKVDAYPGQVWHRAITPGPSLTDINKLERIIRHLYGVPYEKNMLSLALAALDYTDYEMKEDQTSLFCSETQALVYRTWGRIRGRINEFTPTDFGLIKKMCPHFSVGPVTPIEEVLN